MRKLSCINVYPNVITTVQEDSDRERKTQCNYMMMDAETGVLHFEDGRSGHKPRDTDDL